MPLINLVTVKHWLISGPIEDKKVELILDTSRKRKILDHKSAPINDLSSCRDPESGLYTPGHFHSVLAQELARVDRGERPLSLVLLEAPQLAGGDWQYLGCQILSSLRSIDLAARLNKDRVAVLLPDAPRGWTKRWIALLLSEIMKLPAFVPDDFFWGVALAHPREGRNPTEFMALAEGDLRRNQEANPDDDPEDSSEDLETSIATDERDLLFAGFQVLTGAKNK